MIDKTSKTRRVLDGLEKVLEKAPDGFFLGTLPSLAAQWGVNERTIRRCTGHLYQSGGYMLSLERGS